MVSPVKKTIDSISIVPRDEAASTFIVIVVNLPSFPRIGLNQTILSRSNIWIN